MVLKEILFCQGDKKELEAITGEKYEYVNPRNLDREEKGYFETSVVKYERTGRAYQEYGDTGYKAQDPYWNPSGSRKYTEILRSFMVGKAESAQSAIGNLYVKAYNLKADGLVHVSSPTRIVKEYRDMKEVSWMVYGTPVRRKRK